MRIISFAWTTPAIEAKAKTCTRRDWDDKYASHFNAGDLLAGFNKSPRFHGYQIATIRLTQKPHKERYYDVPYSDWQAEGFEYLESIGAKVGKLTPKEIWSQWKSCIDYCWVVRFEIVGLEKEKKRWMD